MSCLLLFLIMLDTYMSLKMSTKKEERKAVQKQTCKIFAFSSFTLTAL